MRGRGGVYHKMPGSVRQGGVIALADFRFD